MSIVVTTPTGHIGRVVAERLLEAGESVTLIVRDPSKVQALSDRGARVKIGSHADAKLLIEATKDAEALFVLVPPDFGTQDIRASYRPFGEAAAEAILKNQIPFVVHLSSVGAELAEGNGPVAGLHVTEGLLGEAAKNLVLLRPAYFMENTLGQIAPILQAGALFTAFRGETRFPMIATRDIGERAAQLLGRRDARGTSIVELQGAGELGYDDVARILSGVLSRPLSHVTVAKAPFIESLTGMGISRVLAESFFELSEGVESGRIRFHEPRGPQNTTPTTYDTFAKEVFAPSLAAASALAA